MYIKDDTYSVKVSVIIPVYNTEDYVADTLTSIVDQELKDIEVIVINDGSVDNSLEIIQSMAVSDRRIRIHNQENRGLSESRNYGIETAKGKYIYFMDSDDLLSPHALLDCYNECERDRLDFVFFDAEVIGKSSSSVVDDYRRTHLLNEGVYEGPDILEKLLKKEVFLSSACLNFVKLAYLRDISLTFYPNIVHEDELFTLLLFLKAGRVGFISAPYFKRRVREDSIMTSKFSRINVIGYFAVANELVRNRYDEVDEFKRFLIDRRLKSMLTAVLFKTRSMGLVNRLYVVMRCILRFRNYVLFKDLFLASFPITRWFSKPK